MRTPIYTQRLVECRDTSEVGGKAANLGRLLRAGFPVPDGFVVNTQAFIDARSRLNGDGILHILPPEIAEAAVAAYRAIGGGSVAVRSSATAEDMAGASMAGQYETFLDVQGENALLDAIKHCWSSLSAPRVTAYLAEHGIDPARVAMAVVVQKLVPADVAGVLFTANPQEGWQREMLVEASWGLGESLVSGRVQPDVLRLDQKTGRVLSSTVADKRVQLKSGNSKEQLVDDASRRLPCLRGKDVHRLWQLGRQAADHFKSPQDIEWAISEGQVYLLQSRPITTSQGAEAYEEALRATRDHIRKEVAAGHGPWALHNLAETLPHPTPLTWSVLQKFMSGSGGFGEMYRQAGFEPSPVVERDGFLDCIGGRIYMDASRAPEMFFENFPFAYDLQALKRNPDASQAPPTLPKGSIWARMSASRRLAAVNGKLRDIAKDYDEKLREELFPELVKYVDESRKIDIGTLTSDKLIELWRQHEARVLNTFGGQSLMPSLIAGMALSDLSMFLSQHVWDQNPDDLAQFISSGGHANRTVTADAELYDVSKGTRTVETWLKEHGHRAPGEFELSAPRWNERPAALQEMAGRLAGGDSPFERHQRNVDQVHAKIEQLWTQLAGSARVELDRRIAMVRRYIAFREDAKDFLMLGYGLLRTLALEAGRRLDVGEDVFYLIREDMFDALRVGFAPHHLIEQRKTVYQAQTKMSLPRVIDEKSIDSLGDAPELAVAVGGHKAFAVSAGEATGPARILRTPTEGGELGKGYILVCPSTDPSWTPLFVNAAGLVLECGGTLSHGAVVAREMGLPAVVIPDATRIFHDGQQIKVDGRRGWAGPPEEASVAIKTDAIDADDTSIASELVPPPPSWKDQRAAKLRNVFTILWVVYLLGFFLLPRALVFQPTMSFIDQLLWPIVRAAGKPMVVVVVAIAIAVCTLLLQRFLTDNNRLLVAKRRVADLKAQAALLPAGSRRRDALLRLAAPVQLRTLMASLVPIGLLLGPMVMPFIWFKERLDPTVPTAPAGSPVQIVAMVDGDWNKPVRLEAPQPLALDETTPVARSLPPIRKTLEHLLTIYNQPRNNPGEPWELAAAPDIARQQTADDLKHYLDGGIPAQGMTWVVRPPKDAVGKFRLNVAPEGQAATYVDIVLGDNQPPVTDRPQVGKGSALKDVRVIYPPSKHEAVFWQPMSRLAGSHVGFVARLGMLDVGWLTLYVLCYLPVLLLLRMVLRLA